MKMSCSMSKWTFLVLLLFVDPINFILSANGAKILFFFAGGTYSHKNGIWPLVSALADRGHNVTLLSPFSKQPRENPKVVDLAPKALAKFFSNVLDQERFISRQNHQQNDDWAKLPAWTADICKIIVKSAQPDVDPVLHSVLSDSTYDLMIINSVFSECGVMWAHHHNTKFIISVSTSMFPWLSDVYGLPIETSWLPDLALQFNYPMGIYDRVKNYLWTLYQFYLRMSSAYPGVEKLMMDTFHLEERPSLLDEERKASLLLMNTYMGTEFARGTPPFVVQIGGMQCWLPTKPLPKDLQSFMDDAKDGVVLIAFGSTIDFSKIPRVYLDIFITAIRKFPTVKFLWKWTGSHPEDVPENLMMVSWLPQAEILAHPKMRAFVSHCGLNSVMESTFNGVPMIGLPLFGDQDYNAYHLRAYDLGVILEARELTQDKMNHALQEILTKTKYKENMQSASTLFRDRAMNPIDTGVFWTEFVLKNDEKTMRLLKPLNYDQPWWQRRLLDTCAVIIAALLIAFVSSIYIIFLFYKLVRRLVRKPVEAHKSSRKLKSS